MSLLFKKRGLKYADNHVYSRLHRAGCELQLSEPESGVHAGGNAGSSTVRSCLRGVQGKLSKHIDELDMKSLPSYESLKAADNIFELYRRFHILRKDRFMLCSSVIEPDDYTVFAENGRILLQKVS